MNGKSPSSNKADTNNNDGTTSDKSLETLLSEKDKLVRRIEQVDVMVDTRFQEKEIYEYFQATFASWENEFAKIPRHGQGVPNARKVRELCCNIKVAMGPNGEFTRNYDDMLETNVPGFRKYSGKIEKFRELLEEKSPSPVTLEKIRETTGELIGSVEAILECLYREK